MFNKDQKRIIQASHHLAFKNRL